MVCRTPKARIQKGKDLENWVVDQLKAFDLDNQARRSYGSGNGNGCKADIDTKTTMLGQALGIECKHMDKLNVPEAWRQTKKLESLGYEPVLVIKQTADNYGDTKAVIYLDSLLQLLSLLKKK
jgi:hypothetical protein